VAVPLIALVALAAAGSTAGSAARPPVAEESVEVRRARLAVVFDERVAGGCERLDPAWVDLTEDGASARVVGLERRAPPGDPGDPLTAPTLHALVFDTSPSMRRRIDEAREAARLYVGQLRPGDAVLLATLDERLVLLREPTVDHGSVVDALDDLTLGTATALWLALDEMFAYLDSYPGRKVAAVITDGCDTLFPAGPPPADVIAAAERSTDLTVFPIAVDAPARCGDGVPLDPRMRLRSLAARTGGECFEIRDTQNLASALARVVERLEREGWITYVPPAHDPVRTEHRIRIRTRRDAPCEVRPASADRRFEPVEDVREEPTLRLVDAGARLTGALATDAGGPIAIDAPVPDLADLREPGALAAMIVDRIESGPDPGEADDPAGATFIVPGAVLLRSRTAFAEALYSRPDYRDWARERIARRRLGLVAATATGVDDTALDGYRAWIAGDRWEPEPAELRSVLAAWLGDLEVDDLARAVDLTLARQALGDPRAVDAAERGWARFRSWIERAGETSTELGLVVPGYGSSSDVVGFRRIVMRPERGTPAIPEAPIATRFARFLAERVAIAPGDVVEARYHAVSRREARALRKALRQAGGPGSFDPDELCATIVTVSIAGRREEAIAWFRTTGPKADRAVGSRPIAWTTGAGALREAFGALREVGGPVLLPPPDGIGPTRSGVDEDPSAARSR